MTTQPGRRPSSRSAPPARSSDAELLQAIAEGSDTALAELRRRYGRAVGQVCRAVAGVEREDCEQEVFARIWRKAVLFDPGRGSAPAWLLTVARRTALNLGAARRPPLLMEHPVEAGERPPDLDTLWIRAGLARLPERERSVIELAYYGDLSESEIARRLRVPLGSVKSWKRRGLNRLAILLDEESR
jgi:RNA polymerase sigma factor (sigma-70 family)